MPKYHFNHSNDVLEIAYAGRPNDLQWQEFFSDYKDAVRRYFDGDWAMFADIRAWEIPGPIFAQRIKEMHQWNLNNHLQAIAYLLREDLPAVQKWAIENYIFKNAEEIEHAFFSEQCKAMDWLRSKGFNSE